MYHYDALCSALLLLLLFSPFSAPPPPLWAQPAWSRCPLFPILGFPRALCQRSCALKQTVNTKGKVVADNTMGTRNRHEEHWPASCCAGQQNPGLSSACSCQRCRTMISALRRHALPSCIFHAARWQQILPFLVVFPFTDSRYTYIYIAMLQKELLYPG
jgi:hypothetical protein